MYKFDFSNPIFCHNTLSTTGKKERTNNNITENNNNGSDGVAYINCTRVKSANDKLTKSVVGSGRYTFKLKIR